MSGEISGPSGYALAGMLLVEYQRQLVKEGQVSRDTAFELGSAAKEVSVIYDAIDDSARKWAKTMDQVSFAMSVYSAGQQAASMPGTFEQGKAIESQPTPELRAKAEADWVHEWATAHEKMSTKDIAKDIAWDSVGHVDTLAREQLGRDDAADRKISESMQTIEKGSDELGDKTRKLIEKDQEVAVEAYKIGGSLSRAG